MGYVPLYCVACAGPVSHGFGWDAAIEDAEAGWSLNDVDDLAWLDGLRVVTADGASEVRSPSFTHACVTWAPTGRPLSARVCAYLRGWH